MQFTTVTKRQSGHSNVDYTWWWIHNNLRILP